MIIDRMAENLTQVGTELLKAVKGKRNCWLDLVAQPGNKVRVIDIALQRNKHPESELPGPFVKIDRHGNRMTPHHCRFR
ncbi:MAG TPA: hypothetical protein VJ624_02375 [Thermodesulfobacteriota bacterium]|nr:hypothetical protein [Thermodesulfobacteriota bacterium]